MAARTRFSRRRKVLLVAVLLLMAAMVALRLMGIAGFNGTEPRAMDWNDDGVATRDRAAFQAALADKPCPGGNIGRRRTR